MSDITAILHTQDFRGDHTADIAIILDADPNETIQQLVDRALRPRVATRSGPQYVGYYGDHIELKIAMPRRPIEYGDRLADQSQ